MSPPNRTGSDSDRTHRLLHKWVLSKPAAVILRLAEDNPRNHPNTNNFVIFVSFVDPSFLGLFQLLVFCFCLDQYWQIRVSIFPECEEILIPGPALR
jgi:hypothetical protein